MNVDEFVVDDDEEE